jgi:peptidyl-prolyl cis-trans isomerase SurA
MRVMGVLRAALAVAGLPALNAAELYGQDSAATAAVDTAPPPARDTAFVVDRVVAVVGNRPVLASQVDEEIFSRQSQGIKIPESPDGIRQVRRQIVSSIIDEELLVQQAQRDTGITVTDEEVASGVEEQIRKIRSNFSSEVDYTSELRKAGFQTPEEYRRWLTDQQSRITRGEWVDPAASRTPFGVVAD